MCRNIRTLANFDPPANEDEIRASALQFVRKLSGCTHPSRANEAAFDRAVDEVTLAAQRLLARDELRLHQRDGNHPRIVEAIHELRQHEGLSGQLLLVRVLRQQLIELDLPRDVAGAVARLAKVEELLEGGEVVAAFAAMADAV